MVFEIDCVFYSGILAFEEYCKKNKISDPYQEDLDISRKYFREEKLSNGTVITIVAPKEEYEEQDKIRLQELKKKKKKSIIKNEIYFQMDICGITLTEVSLYANN